MIPNEFRSQDWGRHLGRDSKIWGSSCGSVLGASQNETWKVIARPVGILLPSIPRPTIVLVFSSKGNLHIEYL